MAASLKIQRRQRVERSSNDRRLPTQSGKSIYSKAVVQHRSHRSRAVVELVHDFSCIDHNSEMRKKTYPSDMCQDQRYTDCSVGSGMRWITYWINASGSLMPESKPDRACSSAILTSGPGDRPISRIRSFAPSGSTDR